MSPPETQAARKWLEDSAGRVADLPRSEAELQALLEQTCSEKKKANEHARRLKLLHFKATKAKKPGQPASVPPAPANLEQEFAALRLKVEEASLDSVQGLLQMLRGTEWPQELQELKEIAEVAERRRQELAEAAQRRQAAAEEAEAELQRLRKSKEALLAAKAACTRSRADRAQEAVEDGESTSATKEQNSNPSSRSSSDVGLRTETPESVAAAPAPVERPAKGKGKGAPKAPPKCKAKAKASPGNGFVNFHWQVIKEDDDPQCGKEFLARLEALKPAECEAPASMAPSPPDTIFTTKMELEVPTALMELYWKKREGSQAPRRHSIDVTSSGRPSLLDEKKLQMLGISLKRHEHRNQGVKGAEAICSIKCAILRCDFEVLHIECLSVIRTVIKQHENDGQPVSVFAAQNGEEALHGLRCPIEHRLIYELCKVPQIVDRLECMLFHETFKDSLSNCQRDLATHVKALEMLGSKRQSIERFFLTAWRLGQSLNRSSKRASQAPNGFELASLEKLAETKSTKLPRLSVLHFVLALLSQQEADSLFTQEDLALLQEATLRKTHKVYSDCIEVAQGLYSVQNICQTGMYVRPSGESVAIQRRRRTLPARSPSKDHEGDLDDDDLFFEVMQQFVQEHLFLAEDLSEGAFNLILLYKELGIYFDDLRSVYPPPKNENEPRKDLVEVFTRFAQQIRLHREQVEAEKLRELLKG